MTDLEKATMLCDKHKPTGGTIGCCVKCAVENLSHIISKIDYLFCEPNEHGISDYDLHFDAEFVYTKIKRLVDGQKFPIDTR